MLDKRGNYLKFISLLNSYKSDEITIHELQGLVISYIGATPNVVANAIRAMGMTGLIKDIGNSRFEINRKKIDGEMQ